MKALVINCSPVKDGATAWIAQTIAEQLRENYATEETCIDDYNIGFCRGCRTCHQTARCVQQDDMDRLMEKLDAAEILVCVSPSYWADVPGQFKAFIDRCTPWANTHEPHAKLSPGKKGYAIALRTGPNEKECQRIIETIRHFYGHMEIQFCGSLALCSVECRADAERRQQEISAWADGQITRIGA